MEETTWKIGFPPQLQAAVFAQVLFSDYAVSDRKEALQPSGVFLMPSGWLRGVSELDVRISRLLLCSLKLKGLGMTRGFFYSFLSFHLLLLLMCLQP